MKYITLRLNFWKDEFVLNEVAKLMQSLTTKESQILYARQLIYQYLLNQNDQAEWSAAIKADGYRIAKDFLLTPYHSIFQTALDELERQRVIYCQADWIVPLHYHKHCSMKMNPNQINNVKDKATIIPPKASKMLLYIWGLIEEKDIPDDIWDHLLEPTTHPSTPGSTHPSTPEPWVEPLIKTSIEVLTEIEKGTLTPSASLDEASSGESISPAEGRGSASPDGSTAVAFNPSRISGQFDLDKSNKESNKESINPDTNGKVYCIKKDQDFNTDEYEFRRLPCRLCRADCDWKGLNENEKSEKVKLEQEK